MAVAAHARAESFAVSCVMKSEDHRLARRGAEDGQGRAYDDELSRCIIDRLAGLAPYRPAGRRDVMKAVKFFSWLIDWFDRRNKFIIIFVFADVLYDGCQLICTDTK
jgi:hypothetical protein